MASAIIGDKKMTTKLNEGVLPYLIFGFKGGGSLQEKIRYSEGTAPIELFVWKSDQIEDIYNGQIQIEEVFGIFNKGNTLNKLTNDWFEVTSKMKERCHSFTIDDDLNSYDFYLDQNNQLIKYNLNNSLNVQSLESIETKAEILSAYHHYDREAEFSFEIREEGFYTFFVSHWQQNTDDFDINYVVVNPGNEHLSFDLIPNKITYLVFFLTWICVLIISSSVIGIRALRKNNLSYLSILILLSYTVITGYLILRYAYWRIFSNYGKVNSYFETLVNLLEVSTMMFYLIIINLVASGYKIVTDNFSCGRFVKNIVVMSLIVVTSLFLRYTNFFLLIFVAVEVVIMVIFLKFDISWWVERLKEINSELNPIFQEEREFIESNTLKIKYYKAFLIYLMIYSFMEVTVLWLRPFLALYHEWIFVLAQQIINLVSMTFLFVTLTYSIQFKKFQGINDGAMIAPNPYFRDRGLRIWGEIIAIKSDHETESFSIHLGMESGPAGIFQEKSPAHMTKRAKVYQSPAAEEESKIEESKNPIHSIRDVAPNRVINNSTLKIFENGPENKEESKEFQRFSQVKNSHWTEEVLGRTFSNSWDDSLNLFDVQNIIDYRGSQNIRKYEYVKTMNPQNVHKSPKKRKRANSEGRHERSPLPKNLWNIEEEKDSSSLSFVGPDMIDFEILL